MWQTRSSDLGTAWQESLYNLVALPIELPTNTREAQNQIPCASQRCQDFEDVDDFEDFEAFEILSCSKCQKPLNA